MPSESLTAQVEAVPPDVTAKITQSATNEGVARATGVLALGNIASRILGLAREIVLTNLFGASAAVDAFKVATIVPKALYDLLIGGHVNSAIIPVLSEIVTVKGRDELWRLVSVLMTLITAALAVLVLLLEAFAPQVVHLVSGGAPSTTLALATHLLRLTAPALIFLSLFAILSGALYALRSFTWPAFAGVVFNGGIVLVTLLFAPPLEFQVSLPAAGGLPIWAIARPAGGITVVAFGWLFGAIAQLVLQLPGLRGAHFRMTINWRHPAVRRIVALYIPVMFSLILDTLVIRTFSYNLASQTGVGSIAYMDWATTLIQFPHGLIATAISIAILPTLSRQAALLKVDGATAFKDTLGLGLRLATTLILPATVGLFVLATPIVALLFQHGAFTVHDTTITALALRLYLIGLPFATLDLLLVYAFYARQDTLTPALVGLFSLILYMLVAIALFPRFGLFSLMVADSTKHIIHATISGVLLGRRLGGFGNQKLVLTLLKTGAAAAGMGLAAGLLLPVLAARFTGGLISELLVVGLSGGASVLVFFALAGVLRIAELRWIVGLFKQRLLRG
ncbi:MAG: murein biosynthesis integral membrane protein MurJ [Anaerolineae bacterium]|nr:murein biosynthesis integral membrane protein MurJ [Anaerolineae bacterium]